ncbi:MAG: DUF899 family protein [Candidatus Marinimicrobia bacterium]|nr:DUF899 family protein [Candidatus Neomarinimicrobiota bacterium]
MDITKRIESLEKEMMETKKELAKLRGEQTHPLIQDYTFLNKSNKTVQLSELFGGKNELIMPFNMGKKCSYCTLWADGYNGFVNHLEDRAAFVVVSPDSPEIQQEFAASRDWKFSMVSSQNMDFYKEMDMLGKEGGTWPGVVTFIKNENGEIFRYAKSYFGPGDNFCAMWDFNDLLPIQDETWAPKYTYK